MRYRLRASLASTGRRRALHRGLRRRGRHARNDAQRKARKRERAARIVDHVVSPRLGKGSLYRSFDKALPVPNHYYSNLARWHQLAMMKASGDLRALRDLERTALDQGPLQDFITLVELDLGFPLYRAVSDAKVLPIPPGATVAMAAGRRP